MLADFQKGKVQDLLGDDVVRCKKMFFHYGYADYDSCLTGRLRLVPPDELKKALEADFKSMVAAGMFYAEPPTFQEILARLQEVEQLLNESISAHYHAPQVKDSEAKNWTYKGASDRITCSKSSRLPGPQSTVSVFSNCRIRVDRESF